MGVLPTPPSLSAQRSHVLQPPVPGVCGHAVPGREPLRLGDWAEKGEGKGGFGCFNKVRHLFPPVSSFMDWGVGGQKLRGSSSRQILELQGPQAQPAATLVNLAVGLES